MARDRAGANSPVLLSFLSGLTYRVVGRNGLRFISFSARAREVLERVSLPACGPHVRYTHTQAAAYIVVAGGADDKEHYRTLGILACVWASANECLSLSLSFCPDARTPPESAEQQQHEDTHTHSQKNARVNNLMVTEMLNNASASLCQCAFIHIMYAGREREKERRSKVFAPLTFFSPR